MSCLFAFTLAISNCVTAQELSTTIFDDREEFEHIHRMGNGNILVSGKSNELGNKSDLVVMLDGQGNEIKRKVICSVCVTAPILYSRETAVMDIIHVRADGGIYTSDLEMNETEEIYKIAGDRFESIQTYQVLERNHFIIVVSYAVENSVKGLLHSVIDTRSKQLVNQKFNVEFPDISGSIGIDMFDDQGVIDGYNTIEDGMSTAHLIRLGRDRSVVEWEVELTFGDIVLEDAIVTARQDVYAVGRIADPDDNNHWRGILVAYDENGNHLNTVIYDADHLYESGYTQYTKSFFEIVELPGSGRLIISGYDGGEYDGDDVSDALFLEVNQEGEVIRGYKQKEITEISRGSSFLHSNGQFVFLSNSYKNSSVGEGAFITFTDFTSSIDELEVVASEFISFANPVNDVLAFEIRNGSLDGAISILDVRGQEVLNSTDKATINTGGLDSGYYIFRAQVDGQVIALPFIKI